MMCLCDADSVFKLKLVCHSVATASIQLLQQPSGQPLDSAERSSIRLKLEVVGVGIVTQWCHSSTDSR